MRYIYFFLLLAFIATSIPSYTEASHRNRIDTSDLDDDIVESFSIPILFGVELEDIVPDFGDPRGGGTREHEGQDMHAPEGTPVVSPTEAVVASIGDGDSSGLYVTTYNPGGEQFRYMHLASIGDIERGDELGVGDLIGTVGDTGNAGEGVFHLHFEVRDGRTAQDPYERLDGSFSVKDKMSFLRDILRNVDEDEDEYASFLVDEFPEDFRTALEEGYPLPDEIEDALKDAVITTVVSLQQQLEEIIARIPSVLVRELRMGDSGSEVMLLQVYLLYNTTGAARNQLAATGATGYFGAITEAALLSYQNSTDITATGIYNSKTRAEMMK